MFNMFYIVVISKKSTHTLISEFQISQDMVGGNRKSRSLKRYNRRTSSGTFVEYRRERPGKPSCPTGRPLPGTARGTKTEVRKMTKTQRRPSRPFGGVLSSPALRAVMKERALAIAVEPVKGTNVYMPGTVCMKTAGRDAGQLCVVVEKVDAHFVKIDGNTRARKVNVKHLEPTGKRVDIKGKDVKTLLA